MAIRVLVVCSLVVCALLIQSITTAEENDTVKPAVESIKKLQQERVEVLEKVVEGCDLMYRRGTISYSILSQRTVDLLEAKLELAESKKQRIEILKETVAQQQQRYDYQKTLVEQGVTSTLNMHDAHADLLASKIALAKEQTK